MHTIKQLRKRSKTKEPIRSSNRERKLPEHFFDTFHLPQHSSDPETVRRMLSNTVRAEEEGLFDLVSPSTYYMEENARRLMEESLGLDGTNYEEDSYQHRAASSALGIISNLWNLPTKDGKVNGMACRDCSQANMIAGIAALLAFKKAANPEAVPNFIVTAHSNSVWERFARLFNVEMRRADSENSGYELISLFDENTFLIVATVGSLVTGADDKVEVFDKFLKTVAQPGSFSPCLHVDASVGGFFKPFLPNVSKWDFRLGSVDSIVSAADHYGLVYPSLGWTVWRNEEYMSHILDICAIEKLWPGQSSFLMPGTLGNITGQLFQFMRLGYDGYRNTHFERLEIARYISAKLSVTGWFETLIPIPENPILVFTVRKGLQWNIRQLDKAMKQRGWKLAVYELPARWDRTLAMRIVIRQGVNQEIADMLISDIKETVRELERL